MSVARRWSRATRVPVTTIARSASSALIGVIGVFWADATPAVAIAVKPIPEGYHSVTPYLIIKDAAKALDFYKHAFGAVELHARGGACRRP